MRLAQVQVEVLDREDDDHRSESTALSNPFHNKANKHKYSYSIFNTFNTLVNVNHSSYKILCPLWYIDR